MACAAISALNKVYLGFQPIQTRITVSSTCSCRTHCILKTLTIPLSLQWYLPWCHPSLEQDLGQDQWHCVSAAYNTMCRNQMSCSWPSCHDFYDIYEVPQSTYTVSAVAVKDLLALVFNFVILRHSARKRIQSCCSCRRLHCITIAATMPLQHYCRRPAAEDMTKSPEPLNFLIVWISNTRRQGYTDLQSPVECLDHKYCSRYNMQSCQAMLGCAVDQDFMKTMTLDSELRLKKQDSHSVMVSWCDVVSHCDHHDPANSPSTPHIKARHVCTDCQDARASTSSKDRVLLSYSNTVLTVFWRK